MIAGTIAGSDRYCGLHRGFAAAFEFLRRGDLPDLPSGRYEIDGERIFALVERATGRGTAGARLEVHRRHIDIQVSLDGREQIGWRALADCQAIDSPFSEERDIGFYTDRPAAWLPLPQGQFMIFFADDAHAPLAADGPLHKVVIKVLAE
jgi:YhcH/YjgK/YiaL family protein